MSVYSFTSYSSGAQDKTLLMNGFIASSSKDLYSFSACEFYVAKTLPHLARARCRKSDHEKIIPHAHQERREGALLAWTERVPDCTSLR